VIAVLTLLFYLSVELLSGNAKFFSQFHEYPTQAKIILIFSNITLFFQDWMLFLAIEAKKLVFTPNFSKSDLPLYSGLIIPQAWTLGLEVSFYLIAPFILTRKKILFLLLMLSFALRIFLYQIGLGREDPWVYRFFPTELVFFILGALSQQVLMPLYKHIIPKQSFELTTRVSTYFLILFTCAYWLIPLNNIIKSVALFFMFLFLMPFTFLFQESKSWDKLIGELSYPIYISHMLILLIMNSAFEKLQIANKTSLAILVVILSILFSILLNLWITKPVEILRNRIKLGNRMSKGLNPKDTLI
jgi:peptidoglycan/LPS O-acetylase OafA/YrhL